MNHVRVWIKFGNKRLSVAQAALQIGISQMGLWNRLRRGVSRDELLRPGYGPRGKPKTPFMAAINGEITADQYLKAEAARDRESDDGNVHPDDMANSERTGTDDASR
jgi:hypothetical protein